MFDKSYEISPGQFNLSDVITAGYFRMALDYTEQQSDRGKVHRLLLIARDTVGLPHSKRIKLLARAEQLALNLQDRRTLSTIIAAYQMLDTEANAKQKFMTFLADPDVNSTDLRHLADSFQTLDKRISYGAWVADALSLRLATAEAEFDTVHAYRTVSLLYRRNGDPLKAKAALMRGLELVESIQDAYYKESAGNSLAKTALAYGHVKLAYQYADSRVLHSAYAAYAARTGRTQEAIDITATLGANLYVNLRIDTTRKIIDEALTRGDVATAQTFLKLLPEYMHDVAAIYWLRLADIEKTRHRVPAAEAAIDKALAPYLQGPPDASRTYNYPRLFVTATRLLANGELDKARQLSERFDFFINTLDSDRPRDFIEPYSLAATLCAHLGDFECSTRHIMAAHGALQDNNADMPADPSVDSKRSTAKHYSVLGKALGAMAIAQAGGAQAQIELDIEQ